MMEEIVNELKNVIVNEGERFVNCYSSRFSIENKGTLKQFLLTLKEEYKKILFVEVNIRVFENCEDEEQEAEVLLELINRGLTAKGIENVAIRAISIGNALHKWSNTLEEQALLVFHCFHDLYSEKEKNILRSLRKAQRNEMSLYLKILIISNKDVTRWRLFPESDLDERHVAISEYR